MIAAGQELRRMRLSRKNLYVVPNNLVGQWDLIFREMYPDANLLCVEPKSFQPKKRQDVLRKVRDEDFDGIIMAYSCFSEIPLSQDCRKDSLSEQIDQIKKQLENKAKAVSALRRILKKLEHDLLELEQASSLLEPDITFDTLGITRIFVDEAHNFKNVAIRSKIDNVLGISGGGSMKCQDMMDKIRMVQKQNDGKGAVLATGTPITNSITDVYVMQQYLQSGELAMLDLQSFDSWVGMFAEQTTEFEIDVDTSSYRLATRFARFHNLPELTGMLASVADFHEADRSAGLPEHDGYRDAVIGKTQEFAAYLSDISKRADMVRHGCVRRRDDNMLMITSDGRKAALDMRLIDPALTFTVQSKVCRCAGNAAAVFHRTVFEQSTQLIFCDVSTPKAGFNIYDELKRLLTGFGVPAERIAYIHDAETEKQREALFAKIRRGDIRILIGSTFKLGLGVNIQDRLIALHHIDVPWRPADMTQREGRILRQGNMNQKVEIYRYITEGSFDAYSWQLLETKQRFINDLLSGSLTARSGSDIEDTVLSYAEVKALAVGNPLVKKRVEIANELRRYQALQRKAVETRMHIEKVLSGLPAEITHQKALIAACREDIVFYQLWLADNPSESDKNKAAELRRKMRGMLQRALRAHELQPLEKELMTYRGFRIILPANMSLHKPFLWAERSGRYYIELGETETGNLIRIDNRLDTLEKYLEKLEDALGEKQQMQNDLQAQLQKDEGYSEQIMYYRRELEKLDKKLGVI